MNRLAASVDAHATSGRGKAGASSHVVGAGSWALSTILRYTTRWNRP